MSDQLRQDLEALLDEIDQRGWRSSQRCGENPRTSDCLGNLMYHSLQRKHLNIAVMNRRRDTMIVALGFHIHGHAMPALMFQWNDIAQGVEEITLRIKETLSRI